MRWRKAPQIRRNLAKAVPKAFVSAAQASFAAFILYALTLSTNNPIQENRIHVGHNLHVSHFYVLHCILLIGLVCGTDKNYIHIVFWLYNQFFHCVQDEGPLPSSFMTTMQSRSPLLCSAGHCEGKGPPDLNFTRCRYFLAALRDSMAPFDPLVLPAAVPAPPRFMRSGNQSVHMSSIICNVRTICHIVWTVFGISSEYAICIQQPPALPSVRLLLMQPPAVPACCCRLMLSLIASSFGLNFGGQTDSFLSTTAINIMFILARLLCLLRFVYPRKVFRDSISFLTTLTNFALQCLPRSWFDFCVYNPLLGSVQWKWQVYNCFLNLFFWS